MRGRFEFTVIHLHGEKYYHCGKIEIYIHVCNLNSELASVCVGRWLGSESLLPVHSFWWWNVSRCCNYIVCAIDISPIREVGTLMLCENPSSVPAQLGLITSSRSLFNSIWMCLFLTTTGCLSFMSTLPPSQIACVFWLIILPSFLCLCAHAMYYCLRE